MKGKSAPDLAGKAKKEAVAARTEAKYGAPARGTSRDALRKQMGEAALNYDPAITAGDFKRPAANVAAGTGLLTDAMIQTGHLTDAIMQEEQQ